MKWYQTARIAKEVQTLRECATMSRYTYLVYLVSVQFI
jgi:hypothetical protein